MPLTDTDFRSLRKLLSPLLRDTTQRQYWLNEAFPTNQRLRNIFALDNLDPDAYTQKLLLYLYEQDKTSLIEFLQVICDEQDGDLGRAVQPYLDKINTPAFTPPASALPPEPARPNMQDQPSAASSMPTMQPFPQFTPQTAPTFQLLGNYQIYVSFPYPNTHLMAMYGQQSFNVMGQFTATLNTTRGVLQMQGTWQLMGAQIMMSATSWYTMMPMQTWFQPTTLQITGMGPAGFTTVSGTHEMVVFQRVG